MKFAAFLLAAALSCAAQSNLDSGRKLYMGRCVGCHGSDGSGGGHGPGFLDLRRPRATSKQATRDLIIKGIPDAGMPAFPMPEADADAIAAYVAFLKAPAADNPVAGDQAAGERMFSAKCAGCHMVNGRGGILAPDLSNLARDRKLGQIERMLTDPKTPRGVSARTKDGRTIRGIARYETPFDVGIQATDGKFHSLAMANVAQLSREPALMPKLTATPEEKTNLLAYLTRLNARAGTQAPAPMGSGVSFADVVKPKPGDWPSYHGTHTSNRHSPLTQISAANVAQLAPKWVFPLTGQRALQTTPVVVDGIMYVTAVNEAWALDARTGKQIWRYTRPRTQGLVGDAAGGLNRGVAVLGDRVFMHTDNAHLIALHRLTGQLLWDATMADSKQHYGATGAPLVVKDLVIGGVSGGDEGVRGFLDAYSASTGERVWRFWTVPAPGEKGSETWQGRAWEHGCAATWLTGSYDAELDTLYWPTGNPCPDYNGAERKGDNLYSDSVIALDPSTGKLKWHYQFTPHDLHDWDSTESLVLVDTNFKGKPRKLLLQGNRNGFFYVLDRVTGEFLMAEPFVKRLTWATGIGPDGRPQLAPDSEPTPDGKLTCPSVAGASNWPATAFNPTTGLFYLMAQESCTVYSKNDVWWIPGESFYGGGTRRPPGNEPNPKYLRALDLQTGKIAWEVPVEGGILQSGLLSTAGGVIFYGDSNGSFVAADAKAGKLLWHFETGMQWKSSPMTYAVDGKQYIGVTAGSTIMTFALPGSSR